MTETLTTLARLLFVQEIQEDPSGAALGFHEGGHGRLALRDTNYATHLRLARRSQERQHPVGVSFGEGQAITALILADNDVPTLVREEDPDRVQVLFVGHDGVFRLKRDHPAFDRLRTLLGEALRQKARVWFIAQKRDLALLDVLPARWGVGRFAHSRRWFYGHIQVRRWSLGWPKLRPHSGQQGRHGRPGVEGFGQPAVSSDAASRRMREDLSR